MSMSIETANALVAALPAVKANLIVGTAELNKAIDSVINRGKKLDDSIQLLGLSLLGHTEEHGDITLMNRLLVSFPKGSRRNAFAEWALKFGKFQLNTGADKKDVPFHFARDRVTDMLGAEGVMWTEFKPEQDLDKVFDFGALLQALIKKADQATAKDPSKVKNSELIQLARELAAKATA